SRKSRQPEHLEECFQAIEDVMQLRYRELPMRFQPVNQRPAVFNKGTGHFNGDFSPPTPVGRTEFWRRSYRGHVLRLERKESTDRFDDLFHLGDSGGVVVVNELEPMDLAEAGDGSFRLKQAAEQFENRRLL